MEYKVHCPHLVEYRYIFRKYMSWTLVMICSFYEARTIFVGHLPR